MDHYCTSFNQLYLIRGVALYQSLVEHSREPFVFWVLCFDQLTFDILTRLDKANLKPVSIEALEADDPALLVAKQNRSMVEYFFTCSPIWPLYLLKHHPDIARITYLDADLFFFSDPQPIFDEMGDASILIIPHRFPENLKNLEVSGIYNVGLLSFRQDNNGLECLRWWRERCLEWCYDRLEDGKFADQKYLDDWPTRFQGVHILEHLGANVAPWNAMRYSIREDASGIWVDDQPLIFYHFQGVKLINRWIYDPGCYQYGTIPSSTRRLLYSVYIEQLRHAYLLITQISPSSVVEFAGLRSRAYWGRLFLSRLLHGQLGYLRKPFGTKV